MIIPMYSLYRSSLCSSLYFSHLEEQGYLIWKAKPLTIQTDKGKW